LPEPPPEPGFLVEDESGLLDDDDPDASLLASVRFESALLDPPESLFDSVGFDSGFDSLFPSLDDSLDDFSLGLPAPPFRCALRP
jgi:hypothetical protein